MKDPRGCLDAGEFRTLLFVVLRVNIFTILQRNAFWNGFSKANLFECPRNRIVHGSLATIRLERYIPPELMYIYFAHQTHQIVQGKENEIKF